ncbi:hypothetical protein ES703_69418 [subsurface metagenome]
MREIVRHGSGEAFGPRLRTHGMTDQPDLVEQPLLGKGLGHHDQRHLRGLQHLDRFLWPPSLYCEHQRGIESEHAFGRDLAHIADIRLVAQRGGRIEAGRVDAGKSVFETQRIEDLGDGAADRDNSRRVVDRDIVVERIVHGDSGGERGAAECRTCGSEEERECVTKSHRRITSSGLACFAR